MITYSNPVIPGFFPDPSIVRVGEDDFYLVTSSFEYFPGVPIFHSNDLVNWEQIGSVLTRGSQLNLTGAKSSEGVYAPTLRYHNGTFYMITTDVSGHGNFYVSTTDPRGPWSEPINIPYGNIDPSLMFDDDGKVYVTIQNSSGADSHIIQYEIDIVTGQALTEPVVICRGDGGVWTEAPHLYKINGLYYLVCACGGTGEDHRALIAKSNHPFGPFELYDRPILTHNQLVEHPIQNLGHADFIEDKNGDWWAVFLGTRPINQRYSLLGRETFLAPIHWSEDGWPIIDNNEGNVCSVMEVAKLPGKTNTNNSLYSVDDFNKERLSPTWSFLRKKKEENYSLVDRQGWLRLLGESENLNDLGVPTFISKRQQHIKMEVSTLLQFNPHNEGEEAGLSARLNEQAHYEVGVNLCNGQKVVVAKQTVAGITSEINRQEIYSDTIRLGLHSDSNDYYFTFADTSDDWVVLGKAPIGNLSPESNGGFGKVFTGVCLGIYSTGNGKKCPTPAFFDWFSYKGLD